MPELPEAEVAAAQLRKSIHGARVRGYWIGRSDIIREGLDSLSWYVGARVEAVERRGKTVIIAFVREGNRRFLAAELGLTGLLLFRSVAVRFPQHTHFVMQFDQSREVELRYWNPRRFGRLYLLDSEGLDRYSKRRFGYDPLTMTGDQFRQLTALSRGRRESACRS